MSFDLKYWDIPSWRRSAKPWSPRPPARAASCWTSAAASTVARPDFDGRFRPEKIQIRWLRCRLSEKGCSGDRQANYQGSRTAAVEERWHWKKPKKKIFLIKLIKRSLSWKYRFKELISCSSTAFYFVTGSVIFLALTNTNCVYWQLFFLHFSSFTHLLAVISLLSIMCFKTTYILIIFPLTTNFALEWYEKLYKHRSFLIFKSISFESRTKYFKQGLS